MAFTKEQRLLVLMAIACMGLAVVSAGSGCSTPWEAAEKNREFLNSSEYVSDLIGWCKCANKIRHKDNFLNTCYDAFDLDVAIPSVNCVDRSDLMDLINPVYFCGSFNKTKEDPKPVNITIPPNNTIFTAPMPPSANDSTNLIPPGINSSTDPIPQGTNSSTDPIPQGTNSSTDPISQGTNNTLSDAPKPNNTLSDAPKPNNTSPETGPAITTTPPPVEDLTYLAWLIPLILLLVAAMLGLGCYLHRRTKGARGFHHSTKTNGSTKATNGEA